MRMLPSKTIPFSVTIAFLCGREKIDSKTRCGGGFFENGGKISVFKQKLIPVDGALGVKISLVRKYYL